jgi:tetratricopeptide (TPR) repeat protein
MLKQNPLFGVGMDRYGAYFKQVREVGYPLTHGFELTSSNAHNTFIQLFATGGIFLGLSYLIINGFVIRQAIFGIKNQTGNNRLLLSGVFSAWVAFQAQSLVSIDNIGISIWGWVLGGSIIGISISSSSLGEDSKQFIGRRNDIDLRRLLASVIPTLISVLLISLLYRGDSNTYKAMANFNLQDQRNLLLFKNAQVTVINTPLIDPNYSLRCAHGLILAGFTEEGILELKKIHKADPRNLEALITLALIYEKNNKIPDAIIYREKVKSLDPWNAINLLQLGKNYKVQGNIIKSKEMLDRILSFAIGERGGPIAEQSKKELVQ